MRHVLLVEDNANNRILIEDVFALDDVPGELVSVASGEEALNVVSKLDPFLILMDIGLPGIDGLEATRSLKRNPATKDIPVWAITARAMRDDIDQALSAGCSGYFTKPINPQAVADQIRAFSGKVATSGCHRVAAE